MHYKIGFVFVFLFFILKIKLYLFYNVTKQVIQLILIMLAGTDVSVRMVFVQIGVTCVYNGHVFYTLL